MSSYPLQFLSSGFQAKGAINSKRLVKWDTKYQGICADLLVNAPVPSYTQGRSTKNRKQKEAEARLLASLS